LQTLKEYEPPRLPGRKILLHGHCHYKALLDFAKEESLLKRMGVELKTLDSGCCGMAGPFGFEKTKIDISQAIGERVLLPAMRACDAETIVVTDGFSCREQIAQNSDREAVHIAEILRMGLEEIADSDAVIGRAHVPVRRGSRGSAVA
jgi:Fe-S oxidoreductase